jgi:hypothetical protein
MLGNSADQQIPLDAAVYRPMPKRWIVKTVWLLFGNVGGAFDFG